MNKHKNPWLEIPLTEYVGHMSDSRVRQYQMLSSIFQHAYSFKQPSKLLVLGASDGNGFEHISKKTTSVVSRKQLYNQKSSLKLFGRTYARQKVWGQSWLQSGILQWP